MIWIFLNLAFAAEFHLTQQQIVLEAQTLMASNMERLSLDPRTCKTPRSCSKRVRTVRDNLITLEKDGILTHCPEVSSDEVLLESPQFWRQAKITAQQAGLVPVEPSSIYVAQAESSEGQHMVSLEELADRREKEEQEEKRNLFGSGTLQKVIDKPTAKPSAAEPVSKETKSCEVVHFTGRKGAAVVKRYLDQAACQELCLERKHPEKITHCFFDRSVIWKSNQ